MKRCFLFIFLFVSILFARAEKIQIDSLWYLLDFETREALLTSPQDGSYYYGDIVVPENFIYDGNTYTVKSIAYRAFYYNNANITLTLPNSIERIENEAFYYSKGLKKIVLPPSLNYVGKDAFFACSYLEEVRITDLKEWCNVSFVNFYSNPLFIADSFIVNDKVVEELVIPNTVSNISDFAFYGHDGFKSVIIPESVTTIGQSVFSGCGKLESVYIPSSVEYIGDDAFFESKLLEEVHISDLSSWCNISFENIFANPLILANHLFLNGELIDSLQIPEGVTNLKDYVFAKCLDFSSITLPLSLTSIGNSAFSGCSGLRSLIIPDSVRSIGEMAFANCNNLSDVTISKSLSKIEKDAFKNCNNIFDVYVNDLSGWVNVNFKNVYANPLTYARSFYLNGNLVTDLIFPDSVSNIESLAFCSSNYFSSVIIPESVLSIADSAFYNCDSLKMIKISSSLQSIGKDAFASCDNLDSVYISDLASWCNMSFSNSNSNPLCNAKYFYLNDELIKDLVLSDTIKSIGDYAFCNFDNLNSIVIPKSLKYIGSSAFSGCDSLNSVYISDLTSWCNIFFENQTSNPISFANKLYLNDELVKDLIIPDDVLSIGDYAFYGFPGMSVSFNSALNQIGYNSFANCKFLESVTLNEGLISIAEGAFSNCDTLKTITIPNSVRSLGESCFANCKSLESVTLPNTLDSISNNLFFGCINLTRTFIPSSVKFIGDDAFSGCSGLTEVVIPDSVKIIGSRAFDNCSSINKLVIGNSVVSIGEYAFAVNSKLKEVTLGTSIKEINQGAFVLCDSIDAVRITDLSSFLNIDFMNWGSNPLDYADHFYLNGKEVTNLVIPDSINSCHLSMFSNVESIDSLTVGKSLDSISDFSHYLSMNNTISHLFITDVEAWCNYLNNRPIELYRVKKHILIDGKEVENLIIPESITKIPRKVFSGSDSLKTIYIPKTVERIEYEAFANCPNLQTIYCYSEDIDPYLMQQALGGAIYERKSDTLYVPVSVFDDYLTYCSRYNPFGIILSIHDEPSSMLDNSLPFLSLGFDSGTFSILGLKENTRITLYTIDGKVVGNAISDGNCLTFDLAIPTGTVLLVDIEGEVFKTVVR